MSDAPSIPSSSAAAGCATQVLLMARIRITAQSLPKTLEEACEHWLAVREMYTEGAAPPHSPETWDEFEALEPWLRSTKVYYFAEDPFGRVLEHLTHRFPCRMAPFARYGDANVLTDREAMRTHFGIGWPAFDDPAVDSSQAVHPPPPMLGVLTVAPVHLDGDMAEPLVLSVYHMVAPDLTRYSNGCPLPDLAAIDFESRSSMYEAAKCHARAWYLAFKAAHDNGYTKLADVNVGGYPDEWTGRWIHDRCKWIHDTAFFLIGYHTPSFPFPNVRLVQPPEQVPRDLRTYDHEGVLHVTSWCHSSFLGNGNRRDATLEGRWGCVGPWAPLAWPLTNPWLRFVAAEPPPEAPETRPLDRLCGKPPRTLLYARKHGGVLWTKHSGAPSRSLDAPPRSVEGAEDAAEEAAVAEAAAEEEAAEEEAAEEEAAEEDASARREAAKRPSPAPNPPTNSLKKARERPPKVARGMVEQKACEQWLKALACYTDGSAPPLAPANRAAFDALVPYLKETVVYHEENAAQDVLMEYLRKRLPCAMGRYILTDTQRMCEAFGFDTPLYRSLKTPPPMLGVYTRVPMENAGQKVDVCIYHMIAPDLNAYADGTPTADLRALRETAGNDVSTNDLLYAAARVHATAWYLAFAAAHEHKFTKLSDVLVGGGAFVPEDWHDRFKAKVHDTALYLIGYGAADFAFPEIELVPPPEVPLCNLQEWSGVLHVNAWCHSSFLGNGNCVDDTLDGAWGRSTPIAPFAWPLANPWLSLRAVGNIPQTSRVRPQDRRCGKPPHHLRKTRSLERFFGRDAAEEEAAAEEAAEEEAAEEAAVAEEAAAEPSEPSDALPTADNRDEYFQHLERLVDRATARLEYVDRRLDHLQRHIVDASKRPRRE